jgi:hypothetical protein
MCSPAQGRGGAPTHEFQRGGAQDVAEFEGNSPRSSRGSWGRRFGLEVVSPLLCVVAHGEGNLRWASGAGGDQNGPHRVQRWSLTDRQGSGRSSLARRWWRPWTLVVGGNLSRGCWESSYIGIEIHSSCGGWCLCRTTLGFERGLIRFGFRIGSHVHCDLGKFSFGYFAQDPGRETTSTHIIKWKHFINKRRKYAMAWNPINNYIRPKLI